MIKMITKPINNKLFVFGIYFIWRKPTEIFNVMSGGNKIFRVKRKVTEIGVFPPQFKKKAKDAITLGYKTKI